MKFLLYPQKTELFSVFRGTHKERFDEEGHGKGKEGRSDEVESSGYVQGFKSH